MNAIEVLPRSELDGVLPHLLASSGNSAEVSRRQLDAFHDYLDEGPFEWEGSRCGPIEAPTGLFFAVLLPGRTAIIMIPVPGVAGVDPDDQLRVTVAGLARLRDRRLHYAQALVEPEAVAKGELLVRAGFHTLAPLIYLERDARYPWVDPPSEHDAQWISYGPETRAVFASVVLATYEGSRDCPELTGLRPIDDILLAHRASGCFDPQLWEVALVNGRPAGCILLAKLARGTLLEVVYTGVVPASRGHGVGDLLLRRALARCRAVGARQLTTVVDGRNEPARRLYDRFAFKTAAQRSAYLYCWVGDAPAG